MCIFMMYTCKMITTKLLIMARIGLRVGAVALVIEIQYFFQNGVALPVHVFVILIACFVCWA